MGLPLEEALEAVAQRMQSKDFHWVVMAIRINRKVGGNLAEVLTNVGETLRERERLRRQVKTLSAEGVLSAWILGAPALPRSRSSSLWRNPGYLEPMVTTVMGWIMIAIGVVLYVIGVIWMRNTREDGGLTDDHLGAAPGPRGPVRRSCGGDRPRWEHRTGALRDLILAGRDRGDRRSDPR